MVTMQLEELDREKGRINDEIERVTQVFFCNFLVPFAQTEYDLN